VQTDDYLDRPQTPLFWPEKSGIDKMTEIIDGDLFKEIMEVQRLEDEEKRRFDQNVNFFSIIKDFIKQNIKTKKIKLPICV